MAIYNRIQNNSSTTKLIQQLKASSDQYPPLNKFQEQELINKYKNDRVTLNKLLFMHNIRYVFNMAKKFALKTNDFDALVSDCLYGLAIACNRFDITKGIKFSTYAHNWIFKYSLVNFQTHQAEIDRNSTSIDSPVVYQKNQDESNTTYENFVNEYIDQSINSYKTIDDELSTLEKLNICKNLYNILDNDTEISAKEKNIFTDVIYNRMKIKDVATKYSIENSKVNKIKYQILTKFRNILKKDYNILSMDDILLS